MPTSEAVVRRDGDALVFTGALLRDAVAAAWRQASTALDGVRRFDLTAVPRVDSAGLALLAELAAHAALRQAREAREIIAIDGQPAGLAELAAAYRLDRHLAFASA